MNQLEYVDFVIGLKLGVFSLPTMCWRVVKVVRLIFNETPHLLTLDQEFNDILYSKNNTDFSMKTNLQE